MPGQLVRYGGRAISRAVASHPYYRYGGMAYRAFNTGRAFAPYASAAIRAWKSRGSFKKRKKAANTSKRKRFRRSIGERIGSGNAKRTETSDSAANLRQGQLASKALIDVLHSTNNFLTTRDRNLINYRGVKICMWLKNKLASGDPLYLNVAVVSPKTLPGETTVLPATDFFRSSFNNNRARDMGISINFMDLHCMPINSDLYKIYMHKRLRIPGIYNALDSTPPTSAPQANLGMAGEKWLEFYVPIKRQVRFTDQNSRYPSGNNVYLAWWVSSSQNTTNVDLAEYRLRWVQYFKEPKT